VSGTRNGPWYHNREHQLRLTGRTTCCGFAFSPGARFAFVGWASSPNGSSMTPDGEWPMFEDLCRPPHHPAGVVPRNEAARSKAHGRPPRSQKGQPEHGPGRGACPRSPPTSRRDGRARPRSPGRSRSGCAGGRANDVVTTNEARRDQGRDAEEREDRAATPPKKECRRTAEAHSRVRRARRAEAPSAKGS